MCGFWQTSTNFILLVRPLGCDSLTSGNLWGLASHNPAGNEIWIIRNYPWRTPLARCELHSHYAYKSVHEVVCYIITDSIVCSLYAIIFLHANGKFSIHEFSQSDLLICINSSHCYTAVLNTYSFTKPSAISKGADQLVGGHYMCSQNCSYN